MPSEPSPNLQLWTGCCCSLNPDPICFFSFHLQHLTLTILVLPWLKRFNPFFPPLAQTVGMASETPTVCAPLHHSAPLPRWNQSHLILVLVQDYQWGGTLLSTPYRLHECAIEIPSVVLLLLNHLHNLSRSERGPGKVHWWRLSCGPDPTFLISTQCQILLNSPKNTAHGCLSSLTTISAGI